MEPACIRHTELPGASRLFLDFTYQFDRVARFYRHDPHAAESLAAAAAEIDYPEERRAAMARALEAQNGPSETLARFAQPGTVAVVTGQQVGLFSGPAYTIYKALTAARLAERLSSNGTPAVPIFWLATEDHDFAEINHVWTYDTEHQPVGLRIDAPPDLNGRQRPVGGLRMEHPPVEELRRSLAGFAHADEVAAAVELAYTPGATLGAAFRSLLKTLLGRLGLLYLDPLDPAVRDIGAPLVAEALVAAPELKASLLERNRELEAAGYHAQVHIEQKTSLFFLLENGERVAQRLKDSEFGGLRDRAAQVSPNALLRPVVQDYLLPTAAYIGGPAELAYFAQSQVLYDRLLGRMPVVMSRAGFTLLDARAVKLLERYGMGVTAILVGEDALRERIAHALVPESVDRAFVHAEGGVARSLDELGVQLQQFDPTLAAALDTAHSKIRYQIEKTRSKIARETLRRNSRAEAETRYLGNLIYPHRHLQERFYSILPFLAQHGLDLVDQLYEAVALECPDHRVFTI
jgi:bacillithiol biosynthesis cysteine-adding enzyme BshC